MSNVFVQAAELVGVAYLVWSMLRAVWQGKLPWPLRGGPGDE